jgi:hypothetical protein
MPSEADHLSAAAQNRALATLLSEQADPSWGAVLAFYSALHLVSAYLAKHGYFPRDHGTRAGYIARSRELRPIYENYRRLEERSRWVRYDLRRLQARDVEQLISLDLAAIEALVKPLF